MTSVVSFGECLKFFITTLDISMSRLARALNVDTSLVNRWIHGKRIPPYHSAYIDNITNFLTKHIYNDSQKKQIDEFIKKHSNTDDTEEYKVKINRILYEAQGYSLDIQNKIKKEKIHQRKNHEDDFISINSNESQYIKQKVMNESNNVARLSSNDKIIYGIDSIFTASIPLLESIIRHPCSKYNKIYMTYNSINTIIPSNVTLLEWRDLLVKALIIGWELILVLQIPSHIPITHQFIQLILPAIQTGKVHIYYYECYELIASLRELFIVSGHGALTFFPTKKNDPSSTCCFYLYTKAAIYSYEDYLKLVIESHTRNLIFYYTKDMVSDFSYKLSDINTKYGNHYNYYYDFSMFFLTPKLYDKLIRQTNLDNVTINQSILFFQNQLQIKYRSIYFNEYYDIHYFESIVKMIQNKSIHLYTLSGMKKVSVTYEDIIECLINIINMLHKYPNYHIAFIFYNDYPKRIIGNYFIKERYGVFCEFLSKENIEPIRIAMKEPLIVRAMEDYYIKMWSNIAPINKNHGETILILKRQIELLKNRMVR